MAKESTRRWRRGEIGVVNIGPMGRSKRLLMGGAVLTLGIAVAAALVWSGVNPWWRIGLFFPFWMGGLGVFQAHEGT